MIYSKYSHLNPFLSKHGRNTIWLFAEKILKSGISFAAMVLVARKLGVELFGALNFMNGLVLLISSICNVGMESLLSREIARTPGSSSEVVKFSFLIKFILVSVSGVFLAVGFNLYKEFFQFELQILTPFLLVLILSTFQILEFYFASQSLSKFSVAAYLVGGTVSNLIKVVALIYGAGLILISWLFALEALIVGIIMYQKYKPYSLLDIKKLPSNWLVGYFKSAIPLALAAVSLVIYMRTDQIMIRTLLGVSDVGIYSAALKISEFVYFLPIAIVNSYMPKWSSYSSEGSFLSRGYLRSINKVVLVLILVSLCFSLLGLIWGGHLIKLVYTSEYYRSISVFKVHVFTSVFVFLGVVTSRVLIIEGKEKIILKISVIGALLNIGLNYFLILRYGVVGAAISTLISQAMVSITLLLLFKSTRPIAMHFLKLLLGIYLIKSLLTDENGGS